ncbi:MAG: peptidylprolyl isomerase [Gracilimonas sp.]|nr:peptidylprolyl isomerase [Gracilimonas sp.]
MRRFGYIGSSVVLLFIISTACSIHQDPDTIAKWEDIEVSKSVFKTQYVRYISTTPSGDTFENRKAFIRELIERRIIAAQASKASFDTLKMVRESVERTMEIEAAKAYVRQQVEPKVEYPTESEIKKAFQRTNTKVKLWQIYAATKNEIDNYYNELEQDSDTFEDIAKRSMVTAGEQPDAFEMGWVSWNQMDLAPEKIAFQLKVGAYSKPVKSLKGWHIFKAIDKQETVYVDNSTFLNAREQLKETLYRRRFEEKTVQYIDSVLAETELAIYPKNLDLLWGYLAPSLPNNKNEIPAVLNRESINFDGQSIPPDLTLAVLDNQPFTVADFMQRLPNVPYWQLQPNLRTALESLLKDRFFSQKAEEHDLMDHPDVVKAAEIERVRLLNLAYKNTVADTLALKRIAKPWYERWKNSYIESRVVHFNSYSFKDSALARTFLSELKQNDDHQAILNKFTDDWVKASDTINTANAESHPVIDLINASGNNEQLIEKLWGPYSTGANWLFYEILSSKINYQDFEEVSTRHLEKMQDQISTIAHQEILDAADFDPSDIHYKTESIRSILPFYN